MFVGDFGGDMKKDDDCRLVEVGIFHSRLSERGVAERSLPLIRGASSPYTGVILRILVAVILALRRGKVGKRNPMLLLRRMVKLDTLLQRVSQVLWPKCGRPC